jgi:plasmid stabilization system protein ParE
MSRYRFTDPAARDFDTIIDELDRRSRPAARRVARAIREQCERYAGNPLLGILRDDLAPNIRCFGISLRHLLHDHPRRH